MRLFKQILCGLLLLVALSTSARIAPQKAMKSSLKYNDFKSKNMIVDTNKMKNFQFSFDDIIDPVERENMHMEICNNSPSHCLTNAPIKEGEELYTVKCVFEGEDMPYFAIYNSSFFLESKMKVWFESGETDTYYFQVPAGIYDVCAGYWSYVEGMNGDATLIHEDVVVSTDTIISFSPDELTEKMIIKPLLRNGEEAVLPLYKKLDEMPWYEIDYTDSNIKFSYLNYVLFREDCEIIVSGVAAADFKRDGKETVLLTNKLSDKYHFIYQYFLEDNNGEVQITTTHEKGIRSATVNNYINNFIKYEVPIFSSTPICNKLGVKKYQIGLYSSIWIDNYEWNGGGKLIESSQPTVFCATQPIDNINLKTPTILRLFFKSLLTAPKSQVFNPLKI